VGCAISVANIYYNQPLLTLIARSFPSRGVAYLPMYTQIGVGIGMFVFVPLGDMFERRRLIVSVSLASAAAAALTALAPNLAMLSAASFLLGVMSVIPHLILPFAAQLTDEAQRGKVVGTVLSGLLLGILLARTASGMVGAVAGWRAVYWMAAGLILLLAVAMQRALPESKPAERLRYTELLRSLVTLVREQPLLREASLIGAMLFGAFSVFWAMLVFVLSSPPYHYGARMAGLFGLIGAAGAAAAPIAGRFADRKGVRFTIGLGILTTALSWVVFFAFGHHLWGLILGVTLLDMGVQAGHVSNQTRIYSLVPSARSRLNTVYMVSYFAGGAAGSALSAWAWSLWGWPGICAAGMALTLVALAVHARSTLKTDAEDRLPLSGPGLAIRGHGKASR
jgi:predicted MFS family arabinose efflux permease